LEALEKRTLMAIGVVASAAGEVTSYKSGPSASSDPFGSSNFTTPISDIDVGYFTGSATWSDVGASVPAPAGPVSGTFTVQTSVSGGTYTFPVKNGDWKSSGGEEKWGYTDSVSGSVNGSISNYQNNGNFSFIAGGGALDVDILPDCSAGGLEGVVPLNGRSSTVHSDLAKDGFGDSSTSPAAALGRSTTENGYNNGSGGSEGRVSAGARSPLDIPNIQSVASLGYVDFDNNPGTDDTDIQLLGVVTGSRSADLYLRTGPGRGDWARGSIGKPDDGSLDETPTPTGNSSTPKVGYTRTLADGTVETYLPLTGTWRGMMISRTAPGGEKLVIDWPLNYLGEPTGAPTGVRRLDPTGTTRDSVSLIYVSGTSGRVASMQQTRDGQVIRTVEYTYYGASEAEGSDGDLKYVVKRNGGSSSPITETEYYRWYKGTTYRTAGGGSTQVGYAGALKLWLNGDQYLRASADLGNVETAADFDGSNNPNLVKYASHYYEYNSSKQVTTLIKQATGAGCIACGTSGYGKFTYDYGVATSTAGFGNNAWRTATKLTRPDLTTETVYVNGKSQAIMTVMKDASGNVTSRTWNRYDSSGRTVMTANSSAITGMDTTKPDLVDFNPSTGRAAYLSDTAGLVTTTAYYVATASANTSGEYFLQDTTSDPHLVGYYRARWVQKGDDVTTRVKQAEVTYTDGGATGDGVYYQATSKRFSGSSTTGSGAQTTEYEYPTFFSGTTQFSRRLTKLPRVLASQNGADADTLGAGASSTYVLDERFDQQGRVVWSKDAAGIIGYSEYDPITGGVLKHIADVNTSLTSSFSNLPSGWSTVSGAGLHITNRNLFDPYGRVLRTTDANGNVTARAYDDSPNDGDPVEVRTYQGWDYATQKVVGPITATIFDAAKGVSDRITYSWLGTSDGLPAALPTDNRGTTSDATDDLPAGTESFTDAKLAVRSIDRDKLNESGQVVERNAYVSLSGVSYVPGASGFGSLGSEGTNYLKTYLSYDGAGRLYRTRAPDGTYTWTVFDALGRATSVWKGTDISNFTSTTDPDGSGSPNNMVKLSESIYDNGGLGDGNVTESRQYFGSGLSDYLATKYQYDFRNRLTDVRRPDKVATKYTLNNLGQQLEAVTYADSDADFDFDINSTTRASQIRSIQKSFYDDQGQVYRSQVFEVDPATGYVPVDSLGAWTNDRLTTNYWYDTRGNLVKTASPSGLFSKVKIDGAGRTTATYLSYDADETSYSEATSVSDDVVIEQSKVIFDPGGRVAASTSYKRLGSSPSAGELGANNSFIQVAVMWYDAADRSIGSASYGRDNGSTRYVFNSSTGALIDSDSDGLPDEYENGPRRPNTSDNYIVSRTRYDAAGRVWRSFDNLDAYDSVIGSTSADSGFTEFTYDLLGRRTKMCENWVDGVVAVTETTTGRTTTEWVYDAWGRLKILRAINPKGAGNGIENQETVYLYGDDVDRSRVSYTLYPDSTSTYSVNSTTGVGSISSGSDHVHVAYDRLGRVLSSTDQRGVVHGYTYVPNDQSGAGKLAVDSVDTLPGDNSVSDAVRRIAYTYDDVSRPSLVTSGKNRLATAGGSGDMVVNQVAYGYDGWGNVAWSGQSGGGDWSVGMPTVTYVYGDGAVNGEAKYVRLERVVYPSGRSVYYNYATANEGAALVRLESIAPTPKPYLSGTAGDYYAKFEYIGAGTITAEKRPDAVGASLVYTVDSDWDRFGRVLNHKWVRPASQGSGVTDGFSYTYDRNSNRLTRDYSGTTAAPSALQNSVTSTDTVSSNGFDELYTYDGLDRLASVNRGTLSSGSISSSTFTQNWSGLDALGNWATFGQDVDGDGSAAATVQLREHNAVNEVGSISPASSTSGSDWVDGVYDAAGNMTTMPVPGSETTALNAKYDAWNRMTQATIGSVTYTYKYDGLNRLVAKSTADSVGGAVTGTERLYYNENWQLLETRKGTVDQSQQDMDTSEQYVWSPRYIDALILRDRFTDTSGAAGLDASFDDDGKVITNLGGTEQGRKVIVQPDGKTIVVGYTNSGFASNALAIVRYNENGSFDNTFDGDGKVFEDLSSASDQAFSVALQPDGKILVCGVSNGDGFLVRYTDTGTLDNTFGTGGKVSFGYSGYVDNFWDVAVQPDGKIVVVGNSALQNYTFVIRYNANGTPDNTFDGDGRKDLDPATTGLQTGYGMTIDPTGKVLIAGFGISPSDDSWDAVVVRLNTNGSLDSSFGGGDGVASISTATYASESARAIQIGLNGKINIAGTIIDATTGYNDMLAIRLLTDGSLDSTFSGDGIAVYDATTNPSQQSTDIAYSVIVQPDGKLIVGGRAGYDPAFAVVRFRADGTLDSSFDGDGVATINFTTTNDVGWSMAATPEGKLMIAGYAATTGSDFALARYNGSVGNERLFATSDVQASVTAMVDRTGTVKARLTYTPYGQAMLHTQTFGAATATQTNLAWGVQFQGGRVNAATQLEYFRKRWINTSIGGWTQRDPVGYVDGGNLFAYVTSSPATKRDPSGLTVEWDDIDGDKALDHWGAGSGEPVNIKQGPFTSAIRDSAGFKSAFENTILPLVSSTACGKCDQLDTKLLVDFDFKRTLNITMPGLDRWLAIGDFRLDVEVTGQVWKDNNCVCTYVATAKIKGRDTYHSFDKPGLERNLVKPVMQGLALASNVVAEVFTLGFAEREWFGKPFDISWEMPSIVVRGTCGDKTKQEVEGGL
jgi:uncharacterized delta-60 repeat protein/RHS repeat-associated protein